MNMIKFEVKRNLKSVLIWSFITSTVLVLFMSMFPTMESSDMMDIVMSKMDALPSVMLEMFNISSMVDFSNLTDYFAYAFQFILMVFGIYGAILGASAVSSEEGDKTIEFLYSKPITRGELLFKKLCASIINLSIFSIVIGCFGFMTILIFNKNNNLMSLLMTIKEIFGGAFIVGLIFMAISLLISVLIKSKKSHIQLGIGVFFLTYIVGIFSKLNENIEFLKYFSPYDNFIPANIVENGLNLKYVLVSIIIILISVCITYTVYRKKDFNI